VVTKRLALLLAAASMLGCSPAADTSADSDAEVTIDAGPDAAAAATDDAATDDAATDDAATDAATNDAATNAATDDAATDAATDAAAPATNDAATDAAAPDAAVAGEVITGSLQPGDDSLLVPAEGGDGDAYNDGASFFYWNKAARLAWVHEGGDYVDLDGIEQGPTPWAVTTVEDINASQAVTWDTTALVQAWADGTVPNRGVLLKPLGGSSGPLDYYSDEWAEVAERPLLTVEFIDSAGAGPVVMTFAAPIDTMLTASSRTVTMGQKTGLRVKEGTNHVIVWFDTAALAGGNIVSAMLQLTSYAQFTNSDVEHGLFAVKTAQFDTSAPVLGLAANYPADVGLAADPDVYFHYSFSSIDSADGGAWLDPSSGVDAGHSDNRWPCSDLSASGMASNGGPLEPVAGFPGYLPNANFGEALCLRLAHEAGAANTQGLGNYGVSLHGNVADFPAETIEPQQTQVEELYVRVYVFLGETWGENILNEGGKRPGGISGRQSAQAYAAGWGGRRTDGSNGWSSRGGYFHQVPYDYNPLEGHTMVSNYIYHADMDGAYGDNLPWAISPNGLLAKGRWYCLEQHVQMNTRDGENVLGTSGANDGAVRGWVDGRLAFERTGLRFTDMDYIGIDAADFGLYYGGPGNTPYDQHMAIDNVVVSKTYIGPMVAP
jgi:hypothetical protein